jgi:hypothetical protein
MRAEPGSYSRNRYDCMHVCAFGFGKTLKRTELLCEKQHRKAIV